MKRFFLEIVVFLCGAVVMVYEIAGSRVLGPYLGTSIFIWTSLIGIILGSLSMGYWLGGRLSDREPSYRKLAWIIFGAAGCILLTNLIKEPFLRFLPAIIPGIKWQSVISALILFSPASIFLGMVSPYAVRLRISSLETSGRTVGNLYAISTIGSIAGTFLAGFLLIPLIGTTNILFSLSILLGLLSILCFFRGYVPRKAVLPGILILLSTYSSLAFEHRKMSYIDVDTPYNRVWIYDAIEPLSGKKVKYMRINNESSSAMFLDSDSLVFSYSRFYRLAEYYCPQMHTSLLLGGAAYSYPKFFLKEYTKATMDVVEIDPALTQLAEEHFRLKDDPRLDIIHEDARTFINRTENRYDVIYGDLFRSQYTLPWHLTTLEAVKEYYRVLNEGGCMLVNIISSLQGPGSEFLSAEFSTFREVFPHASVFAVDDPSDLRSVQSIILAAAKSESVDDPLKRLEFDDLLSHDVTHLFTGNDELLTDEYAPVDYMMGKAIK
jgi:spermidine synthase